jgi:D-alanyl-lipoteichoic acid acyltransferase DltB (MBOAT superfamily)
MLFNSYTFIVFFIAVLLIHNLAPLSWKLKKIHLLFASYLFYAVWNPPFIILLWISTLIDFFVGKKLYEAENKAQRKALLIVSLCANLGMLGFFKYGGFLLDNFIAISSSLGFDYTPAKPSIILPVGISFYTFQTLSYTLDMYKKRMLPERSLLDFSLFVTFFPQLVAGPIVRPNELLPQFKQPHTATATQLQKGLLLLTLGLFMKVVLADTMLSSSADTVFGSAQHVLPLDAWLGVLAFSGQIFFDFAGYSTCAIGIAACLGFTLPDNFKYPYAAIGFSDFWRRWHITLSTWLRDYLYIPLGGSKKGISRTYLSLMITMLLGGLWHGASWTFVVWGALHGIYLCVERMFRAKKDQTTVIEESGSVTVIATDTVHTASLAPAVFKSKSFNRFLLALLTFFLVNITWVFFRAQDFSTAWRILGSMFGLYTDGLPVLNTLSIIKVSVITTLLILSHWLMRDTGVLQVAQKMKWWLLGIIWAIMIILLLLSQDTSNSFIYFQF